MLSSEGKTWKFLHVLFWFKHLKCPWLGWMLKQGAGAATCLLQAFNISPLLPYRVGYHRSPRSGEFARLHEMQLNASVGNSTFRPFACYTPSLQWKASPPLPALGKWAILPSAELQMTVWGRGGVHACFKGDWKSLAPPESQVVICHGG